MLPLFLILDLLRERHFAILRDRRLDFPHPGKHRFRLFSQKAKRKTCGVLAQLSLPARSSTPSSVVDVQLPPRVHQLRGLRFGRTLQVRSCERASMVVLSQPGTNSTKQGLDLSSKAGRRHSFRRPRRADCRPQARRHCQHHLTRSLSTSGFPRVSQSALEIPAHFPCALWHAPALPALYVLSRSGPLRLAAQCHLRYALQGTSSSMEEDFTMSLSSQFYVFVCRACEACR